jgi:hypothetical protein
MLKRNGSIALTLASLLMLGMVGTAAVNTYELEDTGYATTAAEYDLVAGQDELAGKVYVWDVFGDVYVQYVANHGWCILETHVEVAADAGSIPQGSGGPIPGQFSQGETFDDCVALAGHYVFDDAFAAGGEVVVAAHAAVRKLETTETGTLTPQLAWQRSSEDAVAAFPGYGGQWDPATQGFTIPLDPEELVWDSGANFDPIVEGWDVPDGREWASWQYAYNNGGAYQNFSDLRRFQAGFDVPEGYVVTGGRLVTPDFSKGIPINDNVYVFVNGADNLLFWGGTRVAQIPGGTFQGLAGRQAIRDATTKGTEPIETGAWYIPGTIPDLTGFVPGANAIDVFAEENERWGGMGKLILELDYELDVLRYETAWADGTRFVNRGNWATYATYVQGTGTLVDTVERELTFLVFDLGGSADDLGGMAWVDGPQQYVAHTVCTEVEGDSAWFTYQIPEGQPNAPGAWVTFKVTSGAQVGYVYAYDQAAMVNRCEARADITGGWGGTSSGSVIVHPGS